MNKEDKYKKENINANEIEETEEKIDIFNILNEKIDKQRKRVEINKGEYKRGVHLWIINSKGEFLLEKRSKEVKKYKGMYSPISGGVQSSEKSIDAIIRETKEEIGLNIEKSKLVYCGTYMREYAFVNVYTIFLDLDFQDLSLQKEEVEKVFFSNKNTLEKNRKKGKVVPSIEESFKVLKNAIKMLNKRKNEE